MDRARARAARALNFGTVLHVRAAAPAAHQRGDLRVRGQRDLRRRLLLDPAPAQGAACVSDLLEQLHFWGWQAIIVAAAITLPLGITQGKEYAELEWPIDIAIAVVWVVFAVNFFGTLARPQRAAPLRRDLVLHRHDRHRRDAAHLQQPGRSRSALFKSYSIYAGVQDAFMQWWYGHNAVAFFLTTPFLGLMYYFLPKAAERPVFSLPAVDPALLVAGVHLHLGRPAPPALHRAAGLGVDAGHGVQRHAVDAVLGRHDQRPAHAARRLEQGRARTRSSSSSSSASRSTACPRSRARCSRSRASTRSSHYTDWTIAHVHGGALGWNGFMTFGMLYWLVAAAVPDQAVLARSSPTHALLDRRRRHPALRRLDVGRGHHAGPDVARVRRRRAASQYPDFVETVIAHSCRCTGCARSAARCTSPASCSWRYNLLHDLAARGRRRTRSRSEVARSARRSARPTPSPRRTASPTSRTSSTASRAAGTACGSGLPVRFTVLVVVAVVGRLAVRDHPDVPDPLERPDDRDGQAVHAARARRPRHLHRARVATTATRR